MGRRRRGGSGLALRLPVYQIIHRPHHNVAILYLHPELQHNLLNWCKRRAYYRASSRCTGELSEHFIAYESRAVNNAASTAQGHYLARDPLHHIDAPGGSLLHMRS